MFPLPSPDAGRSSLGCLLKGPDAATTFGCTREGLLMDRHGRSRVSGCRDTYGSVVRQLDDRAIGLFVFAPNTPPAVPSTASRPNIGYHLVNLRRFPTPSALLTSHDERERAHGQHEAIRPTPTSSDLEHG